MSYLPSPTYNPAVSPVPVLDASSGDPTAKRDPKSVASIGANIQAMQDQAGADRAFDAPVKEGFSAYTSPWITNSQACKRIQGFSDMNMKPKPLPYLAAAIAFSAAALILSSFL